MVLRTIGPRITGPWDLGCLGSKVRGPKVRGSKALGLIILEPFHSVHIFASYASRIPFGGIFSTPVRLLNMTIQAISGEVGCITLTTLELTVTMLHPHVIFPSPEVTTTRGVPFRATFHFTFCVYSLLLFGLQFGFHGLELHGASFLQLVDYHCLGLDDFILDIFQFVFFFLIMVMTTYMKLETS